MHNARATFYLRFRGVSLATFTHRFESRVRLRNSSSPWFTRLSIPERRLVVVCEAQTQNSVAGSLAIDENSRTEPARPNRSHAILV